MLNLPLPQRLDSAHAVFCGQYGDVSRLARERGVFRQTLYRQAYALARDADPARLEPEHTRLRQQLLELQAERDHLRQQLAQAVVIDESKLAQCAATAQALGVSLAAVRDLLAVLMDKTPPSVSRLGRLSKQAALQATAALAVLDEFACPRVRQAAGDEIFVGRRMVLMTIEQHSLCWVGGRLADCRDGREWLKEFERLPALEQVTRDGGQGLEGGVQRLNVCRRQAGKPEVADQGDHFHFVHRGRRALRGVKGKAVRAYRTAEKAEAALKRDRRKGKVKNGRGSAVALRWRQAEAAMDRWSSQEKAFERLRLGLRPFTPDGQLNTPARAEAEVQAALKELTGPEWSRLRTMLRGSKAYTFLARAQQQLGALPVSEGLRQAAVRVESLKRQPELLRQEGPTAGAMRGVLLAASLVLSLSGEAGERALQLVRGVLGSMWRSSSLVEGLNGVLRMQQCRQKRMTQGLLDLKRLYWNMHVFAAGKRKGKSPYKRLGVVLPPGTWWQLLKRSPEQLRRELSALNPAA